MKILLAGMAVVATCLGGFTAHADPLTLTDNQQKYADDNGVSICRYFEVNGVSDNSIDYIINRVADNGPVTDVEEIGAIVNYSIRTYCPWEWDDILSWADTINNPTQQATPKNTI